MKGSAKIKLQLAITALDVEALIDSQLDPEREKQVWSEIRHSPVFCAQYRQLLAQKELLLAWWEEEIRKTGDRPDFSVVIKFEPSVRTTRQS